MTLHTLSTQSCPQLSNTREACCRQGLPVTLGAAGRCWTVGDRRTTLCGHRMQLRDTKAPVFRRQQPQLGRPEPPPYTLGRLQEPHKCPRYKALQGNNGAPCTLNSQLWVGESASTTKQRPRVMVSCQQMLKPPERDSQQGCLHQGGLRGTCPRALSAHEQRKWS